MQFIAHEDPSTEEIFGCEGPLISESPTHRQTPKPKTQPSCPVPSVALRLALRFDSLERFEGSPLHSLGLSKRADVGPVLGLDSQSPARVGRLIRSFGDS